MPRFAPAVMLTACLFVSQVMADSASSVPATTFSPDQVLADRVARHLESCGTLRNFTIHVLVRDGIVTLRGEVATAEQMKEAIRQARQVPGVVQVIHELHIRSAPAGTLQTVQYTNPPAPLSQPGTTTPGTDTGPPAPPPEPLPSYRIPVPAHGMLGTPPLPPIAWPTYAPYNNYSRVAYPTCYPYEAFPYFGPFYPFPKVPLGWRAVKLEWNDGFWYLSTHAQRYDYWVLRFW